MDGGVFRSVSTRAECVHPQPCTPQSVEDFPADEATRSFLSCPEEGCTKTCQSFTNLQKHLDVGKHLVKLERESTLDSVKKKWAEMCKEVSGATQKEKQLPTRKHLGMIPPARSPADGH